MRKLTLEQREFFNVVFAAPAIPKNIAQLCDYEKEFAATCSMVIKDVSHPKWSVTYHSKDSDKQAWVEPDYVSTIDQLNKDKERHVVFAPLGTVCESIETLYDLDVTVRKKAEATGYGFMRVPAVIDHNKFLLMVLDVILEKIK